MRKKVRSKEAGPNEDRHQCRTCIYRACRTGCGMPIGATYYTIRIYAGCDGLGGTAKAYEHNMRQAMQDMYGPKEYCEACKDKIEKCIKQCVNHGKENYEP